MCAAVAEIASLAREAAAAAAWRQWAALGAPLAVQGVAHAVIDPEALLLVSGCLRSSERRLDDVLAWWAAAGSGLLSVQRTTTLLRQFPGAREGLVAFAAEAVKAGDARWARLAKGADAETELVSRGKQGGEPQLASPPALMLRLRAGFGVGVKADLLAVLLAIEGQTATVRRLAEATGYTVAAVRRAADEMVAATFVRRESGRPATYHVDRDRWSVMLGASADSEPTWRFFAQVFAFLAAVEAWGEEQAGRSPYVASSAARDVMEVHEAVFRLNRIPLPNSPFRPGESYLDAFAENVAAITDWLASAHLREGRGFLSGVDTAIEGDADRV